MRYFEIISESQFDEAAEGSLKVGDKIGYTFQMLHPPKSFEGVVTAINPNGTIGIDFNVDGRYQGPSQADYDAAGIHQNQYPIHWAQKVDMETNDPTMADEEVDEAELDEVSMSRMQNGWIILPATMALYGKRVVTPQEAVSEWGSGTLYICTKDEGGRSRVLFVYSSGQGGDDKVGKDFEAIHDQTGASKGMYHVMNVAHFENNELVGSVNNFGLNVKASLAVFK